MILNEWKLEMTLNGLEVDFFFLYAIWVRLVVISHFELIRQGLDVLFYDWWRWVVMGGDTHFFCRIGLYTRWKWIVMVLTADEDLMADDLVIGRKFGIWLIWYFLTTVLLQLFLMAPKKRTMLSLPPLNLNLTVISSLLLTNPLFFMNNLQIGRLNQKE